MWIDGVSIYRLRKHKPSSENDLNKKSTSSYEKVRAEQIEYNAKRAKCYREQALKLYPGLCGRCACEFNREGLSELTVHHVDHNHENNRLMAVIGSYCAFTAMTKSIRNLRIWYAMVILLSIPPPLRPIIRLLI